MNINCQDFPKLQLLTILILSFKAKSTKPYPWVVTFSLLNCTLNKDLKSYEMQIKYYCIFIITLILHIHFDGIECNPLISQKMAWHKKSAQAKIQSFNKMIFVIAFRYYD